MTSSYLLIRISFWICVPQLAQAVREHLADDQLDASTLPPQLMTWAAALLDASARATDCSKEDVKVHVLQGATGSLSMMTSKYVFGSYVISEVKNTPLQGSYGGTFQDIDEHYSKLLLAQGSSKLWPSINEANGNSHILVRATSQHSVNSEVIAMESWVAGEVDPAITSDMLQFDRKCTALVNIGYAFGSSAYLMGKAIKDTFGTTLQSFYVVGKAGGLVGNLGDYQIATQCPNFEVTIMDDPMHDRSDFGPHSPKAQKLYRALSVVASGGGSRQVHVGKVMTFPAVVLESESILKAARDEFGAVGIEMEGYWFKKAFHDTPGAYLYYTSDLPLAEGSSLAHESYPVGEQQTLFNGILRLALVDILDRARGNQLGMTTYSNMFKGVDEGDDQWFAYERLLGSLHQQKSGPLDMSKAYQSFVQSMLIFSTPSVSPQSWQYAWLHLPTNIMSHKTMHFVLHRLDNPYDAGSLPSVLTFSGWPLEGGAYEEASCDGQSDSCTVHVNLRDLVTDIDEFVSNLLLHQMYLEQLKADSATVVGMCHDKSEARASCKARRTCTLVTASPDQISCAHFTQYPWYTSYSVSFVGDEALP